LRYRLVCWVLRRGIVETMERKLNLVQPDGGNKKW